MSKELSPDTKFNVSIQTMYPSKGISDFNWSPSYEQYKQQVGNLQENQDDLYEIIEGLQDEIKELNRQITNLRIAVQ